MRILVLGSSSFAAQGLVELLQEEGHAVLTLDRGRAEDSRPARLKAPISGFVDAVASLGEVDVVVNFILLKDESLEANLGFLKTLLRIGEILQVWKLIHISSVSVVSRKSRGVDESTALEENVRHKGDYSRLKIETERWLRKSWKRGVLEIVRPGFILGGGLVDPIIGIGKTLPLGRLLCLGSASCVVPVIHREAVHRAIARLIARRAAPPLASYLLVSPQSPTRREYLRFASRSLGLGEEVWFLPRSCWMLLLMAGSGALSLLRGRRVNLLARMGHMLDVRNYDASETGRQLGMDLRCDWQETLLDARPAALRNYSLPDAGGIPKPMEKLLEADHEGCVLFIGCGRIVRDRHFPALRELGYQGRVEWWDPFLAKPPEPRGLRLNRIGSLGESRANQVILASPSFARAESLAGLPVSTSRVLMEKPFATGPQESGRILGSIPSGAHAYVLHNYRFKENVRRMVAFLGTVHSGRLIHVRLRFDSPPVALDGAAWLRKERLSRTLLCDYAIHFLDLALLLREGPPRVDTLRHEENARGETALIQGVLRCDNHAVDFLLRQGGNERRCEIEYIFEHYTCMLRFFPDTFEPSLGRRTFVDPLRASAREMAALGSKIAERAGFGTPDPSHRRVLRSFLGQSHEADLRDVKLGRLIGFYSCLFAIGDSVYGGAEAAAPAPSSVMMDAASECQQQLANGMTL
ncbi:MAG: NAD-dependent epimerase/dehydratase family protein [Verrucomicrobia bacterium]|nr:NAD-dependent epimerase/dehydratase family protein [Verrucomicrobiota bacterium]MBI3870636.1 NAD-dependent epimerase/dehydratase family protein [Verrucomicrobiota bacterium]